MNKSFGMSVKLTTWLRSMKCNLWQYLLRWWNYVHSSHQAKIEVLLSTDALRIDVNYSTDYVFRRLHKANSKRMIPKLLFYWKFTRQDCRVTPWLQYIKILWYLDPLRWQDLWPLYYKTKQKLSVNLRKLIYCFTQTSKSFNSERHLFMYCADTSNKVLSREFPENIHECAIFNHITDEFLTVNALSRFKMLTASSARLTSPSTSFNLRSSSVFSAKFRFFHSSLFLRSAAAIASFISILFSNSAFSWRLILCSRGRRAKKSQTINSIPYVAQIQ